MTSRAAVSALRRLARGVSASWEVPPSTTFSGINGPSMSATTTSTDSTTTPLLRRCHRSRLRFSSLVARSSCCGDDNNDDSVAAVKQQQQQMLIHSSAEAATVSHPPPAPTSTTRTPSASSPAPFSTESSSTLLHDPIAIPVHPCHQETANASSSSFDPAVSGAASQTATKVAEAPPCDAPASPAAEQEKRTRTTTPKVAPVVRWQEGGVPLETKERLLGQKACVVWLTGLPASGKSSVAAALERQLAARGRAAALLDGDNVRHGLCADLGFFPEDRAENVRRVGEAARLLSTGGGGLVAVAALVSPYESHRQAVRASVPRGRFVEVFVDNPLSLCEERDPKGLYKAARSGRIKGMTGLDAPYEAPKDPEVTVSPRDATGGPEAAAAEVVRFLVERGLIPPLSSSEEGSVRGGDRAREKNER